MDLQQIVRTVQQGSRDAGVAALQAAAGQPMPPQAALGLGGMAAGIGEVSMARRFLVSVLASGLPLDLQLAAAGILAQAGQLVDARQIIEPLAEANPDHPALQHFMGTLLSQFGDQKGAEACFRRTLEVWPNAGATWLSLAAIRKFKTGDEDITAMEGIAAAIAQTAPDNRSSFFYALGKAYRDIGEIEKSVLTYNKGAVAAQSHRPYNAAIDDRQVDLLVTKFTAPFHERLGMTAGQPTTDKPRPIFVMGLPRSGSTLVEQILTSHSAVADGGEINLFREAARIAGGMSPDALERYASSPEAGDAPWQAVADIYLHLIEERFGPEGRIIDKTLSNSRYLGLIRLAFPTAPIIWMRRDPYDCAWSCFRTHFNRGLDWTWSMGDIARYFNGEDRLWRHWTAMWPDAILTVPYGELVEDSQSWTDRILAHAGLAPEPAVYRFHEQERAVTTSSVAQVREPVNRSGMGVAEPFKPYMGKFTSIYEGV